MQRWPRYEICQKKALRQEIEFKGGQVLVIQTDVCSFEDTQRIVMETIYKWGNIDILIANAGPYMNDLESISQITVDFGNNHQATPGFDICLLR